MALELLSPLYTFENSTNCSKISFDSDSIQNSYRVYWEDACKGSYGNSFFIFFFIFFHFKLFIYEIHSANKSNTTKKKVLLIKIIYEKRKIPRANGIASLPGSRVLTGFQLIKCVFNCFFLNWRKVGSSLMLIGISFQTLRAE